VGITEFVKARLDEDERIAMAACGTGYPRQVPDKPEHWHWECADDDEPVDPDFAIANAAEFLEHGDHYRIGLRSAERYPSSIDIDLCHLVLDGEEIEPQDARHIARHDPARVLREVAAKRRILAGHGPGSTIDDSNGKWRDDPANWDAPVTLCTGHEWVAWPCETVRLLAAIWSDHPDYRAEWRP
jgi:hypothetical protein